MKKEASQKHTTAQPTEYYERQLWVLSLKAKVMCAELQALRAELPEFPRAMLDGDETPSEAFELHGLIGHILAEQAEPLVAALRSVKKSRRSGNKIRPSGDKKSRRSGGKKSRRSGNKKSPSSLRRLGRKTGA